MDLLCLLAYLCTYYGLTVFVGLPVDNELSRDSNNYTPDSARNVLNFEDSNSATPTLQEDSTEGNLTSSQFLPGNCYSWSSICVVSIVIV